MDYEATDRFMSSWVVRAKVNGTYFYLSERDTASDIWDNAVIFRWEHHARSTARMASKDPAFPGFKWRAVSVPQAMNQRPVAKLAGSEQ